MKNLIKLLETLERKRTVGVLVLGKRGRSCDLFIEEDLVYFAGREHSGRVDAEALSRLGLVGPRLSPQALDSAIAATNLVVKPLPEALLERGSITTDERDALMASHISEEIWAHAFRHGESFSFQESHVPEHLLGEDPRRAPLPLKALIELMSSRAASAAAIAKFLPSRKEVLVVTEKGMAHLNASQGDFALRKIFVLIDGFRDLNELIRDVIFFEYYVLARIAVALQSGHLKKTVLPEMKDVVIGKLSPDEARALLPSFRAAVKHAVDEMGARERLATLYERTGDIEEAVIQYNFLGDALYRMRKLAKALKAFQRAHELRPGDPLVTDKVVRIYQEAAEEALREEKRDTAINLLRAGVRIRPDIVELAERLIAVHLEENEVRQVAEVCDAAAARARTVRDPSVALKILKGVLEKLPGEKSFRKKLVNLYLDFAMDAEAVEELEALAQQEEDHGQATRALEIYEKILRIDPEREDLRKILRASTRKPLARRLHRRVPAMKLALGLALGLAAYQYWTYLELQPFREGAVAFGASGPPRAINLERTEREERLLTLAAGAERFQEDHPFSLFVFEAQRLALAYREQSGRLVRDRTRLKEEIHAEAMGLLERGKQEEAAAALKRLISAPPEDPWRARAEEALARLEDYERVAEELRQAAEAAIAAGRWEEGYRAALRILEDHPLSRAVSAVEAPVLVRTIPEGAVLKMGGQLFGPSPQRVRLRPGREQELEAEADGFLPLREPIPVEGGPERLVVLSRRPAWTATLDEPLRFPPVLTGRLALLVLGSGSLHALSRSDGKVLWTHPGGKLVSPVAPPVEVEERLYLPCNDGVIIRFSRQGEVEGRIATGGLISTPLLPWGGTLVFGTSSGAITGWDLGAGAAAWTVAFRGAPARIAAADAGRLLVLAEKGRLLLLEPLGGRVLWEVALGEKVLEGPLHLGEVALAQTGSAEGKGVRAVAVDARSGTIISRRPLAGPLRAVVLPATKRLLVLEDVPGASRLLEVDSATSQESAPVTLPLAASGLHELAGRSGVELTRGGFLYLESGTHRPLWGWRPAKGRVAHAAADRAGLLLVTDSGEAASFTTAP